MKLNTKKENENDTLSVEMDIETRKVYKNVTRHKGRMVPVVEWIISLYINGDKLDEDEVFVEEEFFKSLLSPRKYPMFTCTCGVFGCGGYYVEVIHESDELIWLTEQSPFMDRSIKSSNRFVFSWNQIISFSEELIHKFENLKSIMEMNGLDFYIDVERYSRIIREIKERRNN
ncbi:hypothetical protein ACM1RC_17230 [Paenibacillus azoreducens]|uniref:hypothetical protein n=1 Tax=Paenibacillus azoreducens TaxID=116718 RepID=UPI0039F5E578